jgi:hypothetical protein
LRYEQRGIKGFCLPLRADAGAARSGCQAARSKAQVAARGNDVNYRSILLARSR